MQSNDHHGARLATRLSFLVAGFAIASWAPLVPFTKQRLEVDDSVLGVLILCIGLGAVVAMTAAGALTARFGTKPIVVLGGAGLVLTLPLLTAAPTVISLGVAMLAFGASLGALDVAMNVHAAEVERLSHRPLISGFHALYSIGGVGSAVLLTFFLSAGLPAFPATLLCSVLMALAVFVSAPRLLAKTTGGGGPLFAVPRGIVLLLAALSAITFLAEGSILDWGALLLTEAGHFAKSQGGIGYVFFAVAMTVGRLTGDAITSRIGDRAMVTGGGVVAVAGFVAMLASSTVVALAGFALVGFGASNIVPVLFRRAGNQTVMPAGLAVATVGTCGYAGTLLGPASVGFVSDSFGLPLAFALIAAFLCLVPLFAGRAVSIAPPSRAVAGEQSASPGART